MNMRVVHLLRKYNPDEWGGTETAIQRLLEGLRDQNVSSVIYCPKLETNGHINGNGHSVDPLLASGCEIERFNACVPIWGISEEKRRALVSVGGNLMSFDLVPSLLLERELAVIHSHTLGRLGAIAQVIAKKRNVPFVLSIHGGALDFNEGLKASLNLNGTRGFEWGKIFGLLLKSRKLLDNADALIACNETEARRLRERYPNKKIHVQPHGVVMRHYDVDHREVARAAFPQIVGKKVLLCVSRIDPVKNQSWLIEQMPDVLQNHPDALLVLVGACTNDSYGAEIARQIRECGLAKHVRLTGGIPPGDPRLIGLIQEARVAVLASVSETFGLVLLEAWAGKTPVISSRTSGAITVVRHGENGFLFDLQKPDSFHETLNKVLSNDDLRNELAANGGAMVEREYSSRDLADRVKQLYTELIEEKNALRNPA
jgi:alpha-maltose-1-phosphate synthase